MEQGSTNFFYKGPESEYVRFSSHMQAVLHIPVLFVCVLAFCFDFGFLQHSKNVKTFGISPVIQKQATV